MKIWRRENKEEFDKNFITKFHKKWKQYYGVIINDIEYPSLTNACKTLGVTLTKLKKNYEIIYTGSKWNKGV
jgi:hypothetical protein